MAKEVIILKNFRDEVLSKNTLGTIIVKSYMKFSPPAAEFIAKHDNLRMMVRSGLFPIVGMSWIALTFGLVPMAAFVVLLLSLVVWIFVLCKRKIHFANH